MKIFLHINVDTWQCVQHPIWRVNNNNDVRFPGDAMDTCRKLAEDGQQFDFIFIDANKDGYIQTYDVSARKTYSHPNQIQCIEFY